MEQDAPLSGFVWIKPSKFLEAMCKMNDLDHVLGGVSLKNAELRLTTFWQRYRILFPRHQVFSHMDSGRMPMNRCIPLLLHGDEGVTYRKDGLLVTSFQGIFGSGTSKKQPSADHYKSSSTGIPLNFLRTGFQTRMLICVCPKDW